ncbi:MAG TPA: hypothetical protein VKU89_01825 [Solirubrobacteraceae bacterium]|nr:hypothetical protein [Solirubrobacteraceae bacterium]
MRIFPQRKGDRGAGASAEQAGAPAQAPARACPTCKAPMAADQDWCVQCGTNPSRSMRVRASWYSAGALTGLSALLASGAAAAGVAALTQGSAKEGPHSELALQRPTSTPVAPPPSTPPATSKPVNPGKPETLKLPRRAGTGVPLTSTQTSSAESSSRAESAASSQTSTTTSEASEASGSTGATAGSEAIELQGSELSNYDPRGSYPASALNNPRKAYEEAESVLWQVTVEPGGSRKVGVGLLVDLKQAISIGAVEVRTQTPGFAIEVLGATQPPLPSKRTSNRWLRLGGTKAIKATETFHIHQQRQLRYLLLWVKSVPAALAGSTAEPGHLKLEEVAVFPAA